ncbi:MAG: Mu transposase domain-containing protein [Panacagrimonas sp.]
MRALPASPYEYATWKKAKVHLDYHVEIERRYYSVPHALIGKTVDVRLTASGVEIFQRADPWESCVWPRILIRHAWKRPVPAR